MQQSIPPQPIGAIIELLIVRVIAHETIARPFLPATVHRLKRGACHRAQHRQTCNDAESEDEQLLGYIMPICTACRCLQGGEHVFHHKEDNDPSKDDVAEHLQSDLCLCRYAEMPQSTFSRLPHMHQGWKLRRLKFLGSIASSLLMRV